MAKTEATNRYQRARDAWEKSKADTHWQESQVPCPACGAQMRVVEGFRGESYRIDGDCSASPDHTIHRMGYVGPGGADK